MGRDGNQTDVALGLSVCLLILLDNTETGKLTLCTRVWLHGDIRHAGDVRKLLFQVVDHLGVALGDICGHERMHLGEFRPGDGKHLGGGVELHGARAQGDHGVCQGQVLGLQVTDVAKHLGLRVVGVEYRVRQILGSTLEVGGNWGNSNAFTQADFTLGEDLQDFPQLLSSNGLIQGDSNLRGIVAAEVNTVLTSGVDHCIGFLAVGQLHGDRVENNTAICSVRLDGNIVSKCNQLLTENIGDRHDTLSNSLQASRSVVDGIHGGHVGQKSLSGTDVAGGLFTANVLLTSLQGQAQGTVAQAVFGHTHNTTGNLTLVLVSTGEEGSVRTTKTHRHTQSLGIAKRNISTEFTRRLEDSQGQQISGNAEGTTGLVNVVAQRLEVVNTTLSVGVLSENSNQVVTLLLDQLEVIGENVPDDQVDTESFSARPHDGNSLRVAKVRNDESLARLLLPGDRQSGHGHGHGLSSGSCLIEKGGIGEFQTSQIRGQSLEVQEGLQTTLTDFRLVRSVASVPSRVLQHIPEDNRGDNGGIVARAQVSLARYINLFPIFTQQLQHIRLPQATVQIVPVQLDIHIWRRQLHILPRQNILGEHLRNELIQRRHRRVEGGQHLCRRTWRGANVTSGEGVQWLKGIMRVRIAMLRQCARVNTASSWLLRAGVQATAASIEWRERGLSEGN